MKTNKKGISLIVLVITILVMIIIAAAVILYLDDEKVISNAERAVTENDIQVAKELLVVARTEWRTKGDEIDKTLYPTLQAYGEHKLEEVGFEIGYTEGKVAVLENGLLHSNKTPVVPKGYIASDLETEDEIEEGFVIYEGTESVSTDPDAQETRNQFVWVPVPDIKDFVRKDWGLGSIESYQSYNPDEPGAAEEYAAMKASVEKYGGFYIGRYEGETEYEYNGSLYEFKAAKVVKNAYLADNSKSYETAKSFCESLTSESVVGHLMYGEEWDAILTFISKTDSTYATVYDAEKGNFSKDYNTMITGMNEKYKINNIYDIAGNGWECTAEFAGVTMDESIVLYNYVLRGGAVDTPTKTPASRMAYYAGDPTLVARPALYLK